MAKLVRSRIFAPLAQLLHPPLVRRYSTFITEKLRFEEITHQLTSTASHKPLLGGKNRLLPPDIRIVEVAPRDGLQNETQILALGDKIAFIEMLEKAGLANIEIASFVNPAVIPQMAQAAELTRHFCVEVSRRRKFLPNTVYQVLVPNLKGFEAAAHAGAKEISIFTATTDSFTKHNICCTVEESLRNFSDIVQRATTRNIRVRGYLSCVFDCPYEGRISPARVAAVAKALVNLGCYEVSCGDTLGSGTPGQMLDLLDELHKQQFPMKKLALHMHDTYGQALANILLAVIHGGVRTVDAAAAGLGGCPFASLSPHQPRPGAAAAAAAATAAARKLDADARQAGNRDMQKAFWAAASTKAAIAAAAHAQTVRVSRETEWTSGQKTHLQSAVGNVATEEVVYMFERSGIRTGVFLNELLRASAFICARLQRNSNSKAATALWALQQRDERAEILRKTKGEVHLEG